MFASLVEIAVAWSHWPSFEVGDRIAGSHTLIRVAVLDLEICFQSIPSSLGLGLVNSRRQVWERMGGNELTGQRDEPLCHSNNSH